MNTPSDYSFRMNEEPISETLAEALFAGDKVPDGIPAEWSRVAQAFEALRNLPTPRPGPKEAELTAAMTAVVRGERNARTSARLRRVGKITTLKVAIVGAVFVGATAAAAATGTLPEPVQHVVAHALAHVGVALPAGSSVTPPHHGSMGETRVSGVNTPDCSGLREGSKGCPVSRHGARHTDSGAGKRGGATCRGRAGSVNKTASGKTNQGAAHCATEPVAHTGGSKVSESTTTTTTRDKGRAQPTHGKGATTTHGKGASNVKHGSTTTTTTESTTTTTTRDKGRAQPTHGKGATTTHSKGAS
jgi:hypothetical protein